MAKAASHVPAGFHALTVHLFVNGAANYIEFLKRAFDAVEISRSPSPTGKLMHAEMKIGDTHFIFADDFGEEFQMPPMAIGRLPFYLQLYVPDGDEAFARAVSAGCTPVLEPMDMFWGDRFAQVRDPFGITWAIATRQEDLTQAEVADRQAKLFAGAF
jgi:PhnB protein